MTKLARKKGKTRKWMGPHSVAPRVETGAGGIAEMIEFVEYKPNPGAPTVYVNKIGGIYRMDRTLIRACFVNGSPGPGGNLQYVEAVSLLWEPNRWAEANSQFNFAVSEFMKGTFHGAIPDDGGGRKPRHQ